MEQSILKSTKKILGVSLDDESFDLDIITYINTAFSTLTDLGVGSGEGFVIEDDTSVWEDFLAEQPIELSKIKTCIGLQVRLLFDPPTTSYLLDVLQKQLLEQQWRLNANREATAWEDPNPPIPDLEDVVEIDGGAGI